MTKGSRARLLWTIFALQLVASAARAADIFVTRYDDPVPNGCTANDCSLREAVIQANSDAAKDRIVLSAGTYTLTISGTDDDAQAGDLDLDEDVDLIGPGAPMTIVDGGGIDGVFQVRNSTTSALIQGITIRGGGGAGSQGVGIEVIRATTTLDHCEIRDNAHGGILGDLFATVVVLDSTVADNAVGGVVASQADITLENVTVADNTQSVQLQVSGGGSLSCKHCTVVPAQGTSASQSSGTGSSLNVANSIFVGSCFSFSSGVTISHDGNIESPANTCGFAAANDQASVTALNLDVGVLGKGGGATRTIPLGPTSVARDHAVTANCLASDQRDLDRPVDGDAVPGALCDVGAYEASPERPPTPLFADGVEQGSTAAWSVVHG